jgi:hypothetical protein
MDNHHWGACSPMRRRLHPHPVRRFRFAASGLAAPGQPGPPTLRAGSHSQCLGRALEPSIALQPSIMFHRIGSASGSPNLSTRPDKAEALIFHTNTSACRLALHASCFKLLLNQRPRQPESGARREEVATRHFRSSKGGGF